VLERLTEKARVMVLELATDLDQEWVRATVWVSVPELEMGLELASVTEWEKASVLGSEQGKGKELVSESELELVLE
jgi:hypothetical protein